MHTALYLYEPSEKFPITRLHSRLVPWLVTPSFPKGFAAGLADARLTMEKSNLSGQA